MLIILILILCLGVVAFWLYSPFRQELLFITNEGYSSQFSLQWKFARQGWTLRRETIPWHQVSNNSTLAESIQQHIHKNTQLIVCAPVITFALDGAAEAIKPTGQAVQTVGMGNVSGFDHIFVRQGEDQGWITAGMVTSGIAEKTPLPTVLMYSDTDPRALSEAQLFSENFTGGILDELPVSVHTQREAQSTMTYIQDSGAFLVVVPYLANFTHYLALDSIDGLRWVVDELYAPLIEDEKLEGLVYDDLYLSVLPLLQKREKTLSRELPLIRSYRSHETTWRNWF